MYAQAFSSALWGVTAKPVQVQVDVQGGLPGFYIVGLPDAAVKESRDRVIAALKNSELELPPRRITVNLAPAHLRKQSPVYDLPIALALLAATGQVPPDALDHHLLFGELSLDGRLTPVRGALTFAAVGKVLHIRRIVLPAGNAAEVGVLEECEVLPMRTLRETVDYFCGRSSPPPFRVNVTAWMQSSEIHPVDFSDVRGQPHAKRALEIAAAGGHNVLMMGPPGSGKTMLTSRLPTILPNLTLPEALEVTQIHSLKGLLPADTALLVHRPFRAPHHTISDIALIGGGSYPRPGEVSLAHHGVLFLDELPEFSKRALEVLRQPLEEGEVSIARTAGTVRYPCRFMLVAAMNPCPCGYYGDPVKVCSCTPYQIQKYLSRISGPLWDRFDIHLEVPAVKVRELTHPADAEPSQAIRERVARARDRQRQRYASLAGVATNAQLGMRPLRAHCSLDAEGHRVLSAAVSQLGLSARAYFRILKLSRTIADLAASETIAAQHVGEAIQYRILDRRSRVEYR